MVGQPDGIGTLLHSLPSVVRMQDPFHNELPRPSLTDTRQITPSLRERDL